MSASPALDELKQRHQRIWGAGAYEPLVPLLADLYERFLGHLAPQPGEDLLDVATGTGAIALRAASAGARVTGLDIAPALIDTARYLAQREASRSASTSVTPRPFPTRTRASTRSAPASGSCSPRTTRPPPVS